MKASDMARPPMRPGNPHTFSSPATSSSTPGQQKAHGAGARPAQGATQAASDQPQPLDCFVVYELFASAVTALVSFYLVKSCGVVALNYRTVVSRPVVQQNEASHDADHSADLYWLTSIHIQWFSSGTLVVSTSTEQTPSLRCLDSTSGEDQKQLVGKCIRVAPNAMLASKGRRRRNLALLSRTSRNGKES
jgi:mediator of RNA polymerase II transcription subunit 13